jgi:hypothetical protein
MLTLLLAVWFTAVALHLLRQQMRGELAEPRPMRGPAAAQPERTPTRSGTSAARAAMMVPAARASAVVSAARMRSA